jgi:hypothetical protein
VKRDGATINVAPFNMEFQWIGLSTRSRGAVNATYYCQGAKTTQVGLPLKSIVAAKLTEIFDLRP